MSTSDFDTLLSSKHTSGKMAFFVTLLILHVQTCCALLLQSEDQRLNQHSVITPADIYSQFTSKQELKSILKRPSIEGKDQGNLRDKLSLSTQDSADKKDSEAKIHKDEFDFQKVINLLLQLILLLLRSLHCNCLIILLIKFRLRHV